jgi:cell division protein FtsB
MNIRCQKSKLINRRKVLTDSLILHFTFCIFIFLTFVIGCANPDEKKSNTVQLEQLTQENKELQKQIEQFEKDNEQLKKQVQTLSGLPENVKLENLNKLENIKIGRYTGFFDKDDDGKKETLIVYIQPTDGEGDAIKAVGTAEVQLWDLNKTNNEALLGQWKVGPDELKNLWFETLISIYYRLTFNVADIVENLEEPPTVKVTFTDYLTGKVFNEQKVIKAP